MKIQKLILLILLPLNVFGQSQSEINKVLRDMADEMNRSLPMAIDNYTTVTNVYGGMNKVIYNNQLDKRLFTDYDMNKTDWLDTQTVIITNQFCTDPSMKTFRDLGIDVSWRYTDLYGIFMGQVNLNNSDCK